MIFLDIDASKNNKMPNFDLIEDIASECFMPLAYGGGVKDLECAEKLIKVGIEKIVINSIVLKTLVLSMNFLETWAVKVLLYH